MKTNEKVSNYIKLCSEWAEKFLQMDKEELKKRLPELKEEDGYLKITHFESRLGSAWMMAGSTAWMEKAKQMRRRC